MAVTQYSQVVDAINTHKRYLAKTNHLRPGWRKDKDGLDGELWQCPVPTTEKDRAMPYRQVIWSIALEEDQELWLHASMTFVGITGLRFTPDYRDLRDLHRMFMDPNRKAYQVFVPDEEHVDLANVLHLWQPITGPDPTPDFTRGRGMI